MQNRSSFPARIRNLQILVLTAVSLIAFAALTLPLSLRPAALPLQTGDVAPRDINAPRDDEYVSQVRTEETRQIAEKAVQPIYTDPDPAVARQQINRLNATFQLISLTRSDTTATSDVKQAQLGNLSNVSLTSDNIKLILSLSDSRWNSIQVESLRLLEQIMRAPVRTDNLDAVQASIPSLVNLTFSDDESALVGKFVSAFVVTNSRYSADLTAAAQKSAREAVQPIVQTYKSGERIVSAGEIITPAQMEALQEFKLIQSAQPIETYLGSGAMTLLAAGFIALYFVRRKKVAFLSDPRSLLTAAILLIIFIVVARYVIPNRAIVPYLYPLPAAGLLLTTLFGMESGIILSLVISVLAAYGLPNTLELMPFYLMASLCGVLTLGPARRFWGFFRAGLATAGAGMAVILAYLLPSAAMDWLGLVTLLAAARIDRAVAAQRDQVDRHEVAVEGRGAAPRAGIVSGRLAAVLTEVRERCAWAGPRRMPCAIEGAFGCEALARRLLLEWICIPHNTSIVATVFASSAVRDARLWIRRRSRSRRSPTPSR